MELICIAGGTCSGKTTLALRIRRRLGEGCAVLAMDNYYLPSSLPPAGRAGLNHDLPEAFDWRLLRGHLETLAAGRAVRAPVYDYAIHNRTSRTRLVEPPSVLVLEGLYALFDDSIRSACSVAVFLESTSRQRLHRRLARDARERRRDERTILFKFNEQAEPAYGQAILPTSRWAAVRTDDLGRAEEGVFRLLAESRD